MYQALQSSHFCCSENTACTSPQHHLHCGLGSGFGVKLCEHLKIAKSKEIYKHVSYTP